VARRTSPPLQVLTDPRPPALLPNAVLGMLLFVFVELMLFAGMISAFLIAEAGAVLGWPPPGQPRLPIGETALNSLALLASGAALFAAGHAYRKERRSARAPLALAIALGAFFVGFQGVEWVALIREGLTLTSSTHGGFFYLIVGTHALHAVAALGMLVYAYARLRRRVLNHSTFQAARVFWYFVVGIWPVLYGVVYL
jgi:cytochrome c oxidase subunit 3